MASDIETSYAQRAAEYSRKFGSMSFVHPSDRELVATWADQIDGPLLDAGCGPGHWTNFLANSGKDVRGVDQVPAFIDHARETYPHVPFDVGNFDALTHPLGAFDGILAWYSLIHHQPATIQLPLSEFARVLNPGGTLVLGFFTGPHVEAFEHAITTGFLWPAEALSDELSVAGFHVIETHTRTGGRPRPRPHGAIIARKATKPIQ